MSHKRILKQKAAILFAAFFILVISNSALGRFFVGSFDDVKTKATQLLMKKQKAEALQIVLEFIKLETNKNLNSEVFDFLTKLAQTFVSKEAQDSYETSLNSVLDNPKEAHKAIDQCLQLEPQNTDCLIQKIRLLYRDKNAVDAEKWLEAVAKIIPGSKSFFWLELYLHKDLNGSVFKDKTFIKKINEKPSEDFFILTVLEVERAFLVKNFSRAKEGIDYLEKNYPEYPEIIYFKQRLDSESVEEKTSNSTEVNLMYITKCKGLSKSMARKFRYDFDLCQRSSP